MAEGQQEDGQQEAGQQQRGPQRTAIRDLQQVAYFVAHNFPILEWRLEEDGKFWAIFELTGPFKATRLEWPTSDEAAVFSKYRLLQDTVEKLQEERGDGEHGRHTGHSGRRRGRHTG